MLQVKQEAIDIKEDLSDDPLAFESLEQSYSLPAKVS